MNIHQIPLTAFRVLGVDFSDQNIQHIKPDMLAPTLLDWVYMAKPW